MAYAPPPTTFKCTKCKWKKTYVYMSCTTGFRVCPACGNDTVIRYPASFIEQASSRIITSLLKKRGN